MGNTQKLGNYVNCLFQDASNNVGIGAAPSGSYKLEVTGTLGISGLFTSTAFGSSSFSAGGTGYNKLTIRNTTAGAANGAQLSIGTNADPDQFYVQSFATTFTTSGMNIAGGAVVNGEGPGGLSLAATQSNIGFYTNGAAAANLRMNIASDGTIQQYAGTNQATGGYYNTFGNLYVASTSSQGTDIGGSISIGGKFNGAGAYATFARIQGKKENSSSGQTGGYLAFEVCTDLTNLNTERMRISSGGCVAIGTNVPNDAYRLLISGSDTTASNYCLVVRNSNPTNLIYVRNDGYLYSISAWSGSDRRLKENITDLDNGLNKVLGLKARKFDFINGFKNQFGFIAQEVQEVIPDAVSVFQEEDQMLAIKMDFIVPHLVKAIQELNERLNKAGL
jgi:hypothetical protein